MPPRLTPPRSGLVEPGAGAMTTDVLERQAKMKLLRNPVTWFIVLLLIMTFRNYQLMEVNAIASEKSDLWVAVSLAFIATCWVSRDSQKRNNLWPIDHVMFFCAILFPAYILMTRKWKGVALLFALAIALILTVLVPAWLL